MQHILHPENPDLQKIRLIADLLDRGGVIVYPTDTVYALGCSLQHKRAIEKLAKLKGIKLKNANFSIVFNDLSQLSEYAKHVDRPTFKILNKNLPGPFTFILEATGKIQKLFDSPKQTVGIRIPDNNIVLKIIEYLGHPMVTTSIHDDDEILDYSTDPEIIIGNWESKVDAVIDGGYGLNVPSTVVNLADGEVEIIRQGIGEIRY
jgi:tRNA threonylcarbamoyl adenosine modification protein (Sua5/YciO/YrdC/YwlC family)